MKLSGIIFFFGMWIFIAGLIAVMFSISLIYMTTQHNEPDYPAAMYFGMISLPLMYMGRSFISAAWTIDKNE